MNRTSARLLTACAFAALVLFVSATHARAQTGEKRREGPIPGPVIKLPPGQYDVTAASEEDAARQQKPSTAARADARASQRWEYCAITGISYYKKEFASNFTGVAHVRYMRGGGEQVEGRDEDEALANAMTKLGEEGWELVATRESFNLSDGSGATSHSYFFKRPL